MPDTPKEQQTPAWTERHYCPKELAAIFNMSHGSEEATFTFSFRDRAILGDELRLTSASMRSLSCLAFHPFLDSEHHLPLHDEMRRVENEIVQKIGFIRRGTAHD